MRAVQRAGLPTVAPDLGAARWLELMEVDKKNEGGALRFILLKPLGKAVTADLPPRGLAVKCWRQPSYAARDASTSKRWRFRPCGIA